MGRRGMEMKNGEEEGDVKREKFLLLYGWHTAVSQAVGNYVARTINLMPEGPCPNQGNWSAS